MNGVLNADDKQENIKTHPDLMTGSVTIGDKTELVHLYPDHVRKHVVNILKTGTVQKECLANEDLLLYLEVSSMSTALKTACEEKLLENVAGECVFEILEIAEKYDLLFLRKEAISQIIENFHHLWMSKNFLCLNQDKVEKICNIDEIAKHPDVFRALGKWLDWQHESRLNTYCKLLEIIRKRRKQQDNANCIKSCSVYHVMLMMPSSKSKHAVTAAVFNCDGEVVCHRHIFKSSEIKNHFAVACVQTDETEAPYVYFSSGKHVLRFDPMLNKYDHCDPLAHHRNEGSLVAFGHILYAIGGEHNGNNVMHIEELDTKHHRHKLHMKTFWKSIAKIPDNLKLRSAPCVVYNNKVYIVGQNTRCSLTSTAIVVFDPDDYSVTVTAEYPKSFSECKAVVCEKFIYIASCDGAFLQYEPETNIFISCADLPNKGRHFGMYCDDNKIFTVGGTSVDNNMNQFEKDEYDIQTNSWKRQRDTVCDLPIFGCCDIKVPSSVCIVPFYDTVFTEIKS